MYFHIFHKINLRDDDTKKYVLSTCNITCILFCNNIILTFIYFFKSNQLPGLLYSSHILRSLKTYC